MIEFVLCSILMSCGPLSITEPEKEISINSLYLESEKFNFLIEAKNILLGIKPSTILAFPLLKDNLVPCFAGAATMIIARKETMTTKQKLKPEGMMLMRKPSCQRPKS